MNNRGADQTVRDAGWSSPLLLANPDDRFSHSEAHITSVLICTAISYVFCAKYLVSIRMKGLKILKSLNIILNVLMVILRYQV